MENTKKKFKQDDMIPCISITPGEMYFIGAKSKNLYVWSEADDVIEIEFRDLDAAARSKDKMLVKPRFIVQNNDFLAMYPYLDEIYGGLFSTEDLRDTLKLSPKQMEKAILSLPEGAKESIKNLAATMVDNGVLDSVQRIKVLDEIFGTEMFLKIMN